MAAAYEIDNAPLVLTEKQRSELGGWFRAGFGIEDIALMTDFSEADIRACLAYWRRTGGIWRVVRVSSEKHKQALEIMGVSHA